MKDFIISILFFFFFSSNVHAHIKCPAHAAPGNVYEQCPHVHVANKPIERTYDKCHSLGIVACTVEYTDKTRTKVLVPCNGCIELDTPSPNPCGWICPFPQHTNK